MLEFVRALAPPVSTLVGAVIVARFAITNFRAQKALERRLDWYEKMHSALHSTADLYQRAALANKVNDPVAGEHWGRASAETKRLAALCEQCWLYAHQPGFEAVDRLRTEMQEAHVHHATDAATLAESVTKSCMNAANALSIDIRGDLGMKDLMIHIYKEEGTGRIVARGH